MVRKEQAWDGGTDPTLGVSTTNPDQILGHQLQGSKTSLCG